MMIHEPNLFIISVRHYEDTNLFINEFNEKIHSYKIIQSFRLTSQNMI